MPGESLNAPENVPKEAPGQVTFGELQGEIPGIPDEAPAGLEQPLLETREGPALNSQRQDEPTQEMDELLDAKLLSGENSDMATTSMTSWKRTALRAGACTTPFS